MPRSAQVAQPNVGLAPYDQLEQASLGSLRAPEGWPRCPRSKLELIDPSTGKRAPVRCGSLRCYACLVPVALNYASALGLARPSQKLRLTWVGRTHQEIRQRVRKFHRLLRRQGRQVEHAYSVEPNPRGTGNHIHGWTWGSPITLEELQDAATGAGMGAEVWIGPAHVLPTTPPMIKYGLKSVLDYPPGVTEMWPEAREFLELNGGRLLHATRGFWRDGETEEPIPGVRPAIAVARQRAGVAGKYGFLPHT